MTTLVLFYKVIFYVIPIFRIDSNGEACQNQRVTVVYISLCFRLLKSIKFESTKNKSANDGKGT